MSNHPLSLNRTLERIVIDKVGVMASDATIVDETSVVSCQECKNAPSLYQCPACGRKTCSLECCKAHKQRTGCNGKRNRTSYMPLAHMSDATMASDYHFLEDVLNNVDSGKRLLQSVGGATRRSVSQQQSRKKQVDNQDDTDKLSSVHPIMKLIETKDEEEDGGEPQTKRQRTNNSKWQRLVQQAQERGTTLLLMPPGMQRHVNNTSWHHHKSDTINWKVDVNIHKETKDESPRLVSIPKASEKTTLAETIRTAIPTFSPDEHSVLLKKLPCPSNKPMYLALDAQSTLKDALREQTIIEHPTIDVVPKKALNRFPRFIQEA